MNTPERRHLRLIALFLLCLAWGAPDARFRQAAAAEDAAGTSGLEHDFHQPPTAVRPWVYWWWLKGNVTEESITRDLEAMKSKGIAGLLMFDARGYHEDHVPPPPSRMEFMSPEWRRMLKHAMSEADRLGLTISVNLSSCAGALKGPWLVGDDAPKQLVWTSLDVAGPKRLGVKLPRPEAERSWGVALVAVRCEDSAATDGAGQWGPWKPLEPQTDPNRTAIEVVDLSKKISPEGELTWEVPEGSWTLVRLACETMEGHEYDVDVLDPEAVEGHFRRIGKTLIEDAGPLAGKTLTHFYSVSWEGAIPTWTLAFAEEFRDYRGYDLRPYLPVLAGITVESPEVSERFLRDYYKTLGDCFRDNFYGKLRALSNREGIQWHSESGGPWNRKLSTFKHADQLAYLGRNDMPQGEFWHPYRGLNKPPAMAAHIYGLPLAATEAFTHMRTHWSVYPALLKPYADAAFAEGVNHFVWHTFTASPPELGSPGSEYFAGSHLNPRITWWDEAGAFLDYLARCQVMLRQGLFAADVCCYTSDHQYMHWGRGEKWSDDPSLALGRGYAYDLVNTEVLLERMAVRDGRLVLPDGMSYRVLAVDLASEAVDTRVLEKIIELAEAGATVVLGQRRPVRTHGLQDYPGCDERVQALAAKLWGDAVRSPGFSRNLPPEGGTTNTPRRRALGRGEIISATPIDEALRSKGILPDFEGPCDYLHRSGENLDVYFVSGTGDAECTFRVAGREPELWDPVSGGIRDAAYYRATDDGRTTVPLDLADSGSLFVVFRSKPQGEHLVSVSGPENGLEIAGRSADGIRLELWRDGRYELATSDGNELTVEAAGLPEPQTVAGPWTVDFTPGRGAPEAIILDKLIPWNEHPLEGIRYFSGTGTYRTSFELDETRAGSLVRLQLGRVGNVAEVRLNGRPLGVVWTAPWSVDLTGSARPGRNDLEIEVANLWVNRLVGDTRVPEDERIARSNVRLFSKGEEFRPFQGFSPDTPLEPSGLIGPVRLEFGVRRVAP